MIEPNEFKGQNMMHSMNQGMKNSGKYDMDCDDDEKKNKKQDKKQEFGWDTNWNIKQEKEDMNCGMDKDKKKDMYGDMKKDKKKDMDCNMKKDKKKDMDCDMKKDMKMDMDYNMMQDKKYKMKMQPDMDMSGMMKKEECKNVLIGDKFPEMTVQTTMGMKNLPDDYMGKWLILFSHPGDFTPVCTTEFVSFAKNYDNFRQLGTDLLGLSVDQVQPHMKWTEWIEEKLCTPIPFPIIADPMGEVANKLGMMHHAKKTQTVRAVYFIDPRGIIRMILYYPAEVGRNMEEIIRSLAALQVADKHKVAMPANWPSNELIGDQVIVPPATTMEEAEKNKEENCSYDWWFCYKSLE